MQKNANYCKSNDKATLTLAAVHKTPLNRRTVEWGRQGIENYCTPKATAALIRPLPE